MFQTNAAFLLITILPPRKGENETHFGKLEDRINTGSSCQTKRDMGETSKSPRGA